MVIGLLWQSDKPVEQVIPLASARFAERLGCTPNVCYVHPTLLPDGDRAVDGVLIKSSARVLRQHFWLGIEPEEGSPVA